MTPKEIENKDYKVIFRWSITTKNGKKVYPKNGRPFAIKIPMKQVKNYKRASHFRLALLI